MLPSGPDQPGDASTTDAGLLLTPAALSPAAAAAMRRAAVLWVCAPDGPPRILWHVWDGGEAYVVGDGPEQPLPPGLGDQPGAAVTVLVRDERGGQVSWPARVSRLRPDDDEWPRVTALLAAARLNAPSSGSGSGSGSFVERWAVGSRVLRLTPGTAPAGAPPRR